MQTEMEYVYRVYQEKSFSKAAEDLFLTQPALSMAVRKVEDSLGMPIFDRSVRPMRLTTPSGKSNCAERLAWRLISNARRLLRPHVRPRISRPARR